MPKAVAPGKLILAGEYAVLLGAPAISVSVDAPAIARVESHDGLSFLEDVATGHRYDFEWHRDSGLRWMARDPADRGRVPLAVLQVLGQEIPHPRPFDHLCVQLDTHHFHQQDAAGNSIKLGLGSSAAIVVALVGALTSALGLRISRDKITALSLAAHRLLQGGRGSGVDVLSSSCGGLLKVEPGDPMPTTQNLIWPENLVVLPVWSGSSASTVDMLRKFLRWVEQADAVSQKTIPALKSAAANAAAAWLSRDSRSILAATAQYGQVLEQLDRRAKLGIVTPAHKEIAAISESAGAIYKTAGAGGGDLGYALTTSPRCVTQLRKHLVEAGYLVLERKLAVAGLDLIE